MRAWYIDLEAVPEMAEEMVIEVFLNPTDQPTGNGRLYRVIVKKFLENEKARRKAE